MPKNSKTWKEYRSNSAPTNRTCKEPTCRLRTVSATQPKSETQEAAVNLQVRPFSWRNISKNSEPSVRRRRRCHQKCCRYESSIPSVCSRSAMALVPYRRLESSSRLIEESFDPVPSSSVHMGRCDCKYRLTCRLDVERTKEPPRA